MIGAKKIYILFASMTALSLCYILFLAMTISFENKYAYVLYAEDHIINAQVSDDEQWRIRCDNPLPEKLKQCLVLFEDQYFDYHPGVNPVSIVKAVIQNIKQGHIVRGGSTITMQLARIHEGNRRRTYPQKVKELFLALALELRFSKTDIIKHYAQHAPYGGNTIGYCAAAMRYYGKDADKLTWSEAATLAVLPNAPSKIYPGKSQGILINKRNFLLDKLHAEGFMDSITCRLAKLETLPSRSHYFHSMAPHLLQEFKYAQPDQYNFNTTLDYSLQRNVMTVIDNYQMRYSVNYDIQNIAAMIIRNDGSIASYVGNVSCAEDCGEEVDVLNSLRSPGSTLKPFLYAGALDRGMITTSSFLKDIPVFYNGYSPANFDKKFRGIVRAERALTESLNIPAIDLLSQYGVGAFLEDLKVMDFKDLNQNADHYGLSLILGGAEVKARDLAMSYVNLSRVGQAKEPVRMRLLTDQSTDMYEDFPFSIAASYQISEMLEGVNRPFNQDGWKYFESGKEISWKTGTSYGLRDAWAVGSTSDYTVLVWVGNADGEGRAGLTGVAKAGPILFELFDLLPTSKESVLPLHHFRYKEVCEQSGYAAGLACKKTIQVPVSPDIQRIKACNYHQYVTTDTSGKYRVHNHCDVESISNPMMILDGITNAYYKKQSGISYAIPPFLPTCDEGLSENIQIVYPSADAKILLPTDLNDRKQLLVSQVIVNSAVDSVFWFIDDQLSSISKGEHKVELDVRPGRHVLTVISSSGDEDSRDFVVLEQ